MEEIKPSGANLQGTFRSYWGAIGVPALDKGDGTISNVTHDWANATAALSGGLAITVMRMNVRNLRVDVAKERLCEMAIQNGCQFILLIDDDVIPPHDGLMKMLRLWKSDSKYKILSGVYFSKSDPPMPLIFKGNLKGSYWDWTIDDIIEADGAGAGFLFIDTAMLKKMSKPWFSCDYYFEDPRGQLDDTRNNLSAALVNELSKGKDADKKKVKEIEEEIKNLGIQTNMLHNGGFDPNLMLNKKRDDSTTEDLYFFKKAREELGEKLWIDCSIQCLHQDKRTGRTFGLMPDMPQAHHRWEGKFERGDQVVLDIGAGDAQYWVPEGKPIRIDNDPAAKPDILADARKIPLEDCMADVVIASHVLEHFSYRETISVLKEWVRLLKIGGKLIIVVPNLKWAAEKILDPNVNKIDAERAMFMYYSAQKGDMRSAYQDVHKAGFIPESLGGILKRLDSLGDIEVVTSDGNYGNWREHAYPNDRGYNILAMAKKVKHDTAVSFNLNFAMQEEAKKHVGEKANVDNVPSLKESLKKEEKKPHSKSEAKRVAIMKGKNPIEAAKKVDKEVKNARKV